MSTSLSRLVVVSGPSGAGKGAVIQGALEARPDVHLSVSYTTRPMREGEEEGVAYHFVSGEVFKEMIAREQLLEWAQFPPGSGTYYGTGKDEIRFDGTTLLEVEIQGARQVKEHYPRAVLIFIVPPSLEVLRERLTRRDDVPADKLKARMERAKTEMEEGPRLADYVIVNKEGADGLRRAIEELVALL